MFFLLPSLPPLCYAEISAHRVMRESMERVHEAQRLLDAAKVEFRKLAERQSFRRVEWQEPQTPRFKKGKSYLNKQNLPFYHRFS